ncbi:MAG TPA: MgtC/SapB family protein [Rhodospirillales bacterium]|nr:MgtC/SapB family protein [Rhodospirillales bacterium]
MDGVASWDMAYVTLPELVLRLLAAAILGGLIGLDRELGGKPMGLRTLILVSLGSALMTLLAMELALVSARDLRLNDVDPTRIIQGVISGVGLIGVGALLQRERRLRGATTGASVWLVGGIGIACALGYYVAAAIATGIGLFVLVGLGLIEGWTRRTFGDD